MNDTFLFQNFPPSSPSPRLFSYDCGAPWLSGDGRSVSVLCSRQLPNKTADSSSNRQLISSSASLNVQRCGTELNEDMKNENNISLNRYLMNHCCKPSPGLNIETLNIKQNC